MIKVSGVMLFSAGEVVCVFVCVCVCVCVSVCVCVKVKGVCTVSSCFHLKNTHSLLLPMATLQLRLKGIGVHKKE